MLISFILFFSLCAALWFFTSPAYLAERVAGLYPFAMIVFGLLFLYLFIASKEDYLMWINGILFLACGFACMQDVEKLRRKKAGKEDLEKE